MVNIFRGVRKNGFFIANWDPSADLTVICLVSYHIQSFIITSMFQSGKKTRWFKKSSKENLSSSLYIHMLTEFRPSTYNILVLVTNGIYNVEVIFNIVLELCWFRRHNCWVHIHNFSWNVGKTGWIVEVRTGYMPKNLWYSNGWWYNTC